jgi:hypothetical protein
VTQGCPEFGISLYQSIKRKIPVATAGIGEHPGHRPREFLWILAPVDDRFVDHDRQSALAEKRNRSRGEIPHPGFKLWPYLPEFLRQHFIRLLGRPTDDGRDATTIIQQKPFVLWPQLAFRETGPMEHRPKAIAPVGKVVACDRCALGWIQAAKNHVKVSGEYVRFVADQSQPLPPSPPASVFLRSRGNAL